MPFFWLVLIGVAVAVIILVVRGRRPTGPDPEDGLPGRAPCPAARFVELPGLRLIDLRALPEEDLRLGRINVAIAQLRLERPLPVQVWVVEEATARAWLELEEGALTVLAGRLRDSRVPEGKNLLHVVGAALGAAEAERLAAAGLPLATELGNLGDPPRSLEDLLPALERWSAAPDSRPVPPADVAGDSLLGTDLVSFVTPFAFVDLRRAAPAALSSLKALEWVSAAISALPGTPDHIIWVVAPWVLELLPEKEAIAELGSMVEKARPRKGQRLAVMVPEGATFAGHPLVEELRARGLKPPTEALSMRTPTRGVFLVPALTLLEDTFLYAAWSGR